MKHLSFSAAFVLLSHVGLAQTRIELSLPQFEVMPAEASTVERAGLGGHTPADWKEAWWVGLDEPPVEDAIAMIGRRANGEWDIRAIPAVVPSAMRGTTTDIEAFARHRDLVYLFGSQFGSKRGPLGMDRQFIGRFADPLEASPQASGPLPIELVSTDFVLHRIINDAFLEHRVPLLPRGRGEESAYIRATNHPRVQPTDRAINIEGAVFLASGNLLLGLRYPTTRTGQPILLELEEIEAFFEGGHPQVTRLFVLNHPQQPPFPYGIRALERQGDHIHAILGNLDRRNDRNRSTIIDDHPLGMQAFNLHVRFQTPPEGVLFTSYELIRSFPTEFKMEGLGFFEDGGSFYLYDEKTVIIDVAE